VRVLYCIFKNIGSGTERSTMSVAPPRKTWERTAAFVREVAADPLRTLFFAPDRREPFAALHALADDDS
jgi:hypothetical protein